MPAKGRIGVDFAGVAGGVAGGGVDVIVVVDIAEGGVKAAEHLAQDLGEAGATFWIELIEGGLGSVRDDGDGEGLAGGVGAEGGEVVVGIDEAVAVLFFLVEDNVEGIFVMFVDVVFGAAEEIEDVTGNNRSGKNLKVGMFEGAAGIGAVVFYNLDVGD